LTQQSDTVAAIDGRCRRMDGREWITDPAVISNASAVFNTIGVAMGPRSSPANTARRPAAL